MSERRRQRQKQIVLRSTLIGAAFLALVTLVVILALFVFNKYQIEFSVPDEETVTVEYGVDEPSQVRAWYRGTLLNRKGTELPVVMDGEIDLNAFGTYEVAYTASYKDLTKTVRRTVVVQDTLAPELKLVSDPDRFTSPGHEYEEEGYSAVDNYDGDLTDQVTKTQDGSVITYTVTDSNGNTATAVREIIYKDATAPEVRLKGKKNVRVKLNGTYTEKGYTATDDCDGDLTDQVKVEGEINTSELGDYVLTYTVKDSAGNVGSATRKISVVDTVAPTLALKGDDPLYVQVGDSFEEPGYEAEDNLEGDISQRVVVTDKPDTTEAGIYKVNYSVKDSSDNEATATRTVYVYQKQTDVQVKDPGDKVIYLTFDDGPGQYTQKLLDVLDRYNVKVTFFVTNQYPDYQNLIKAEYEKGHTVAIHSYSHDYAKIYQSQEAFYEDLQEMSDICYAQTNVRPNIIRFPGGSSNTISAHYRQGIMTELTESLGLFGYLYCDWNVTSGDAGETTDTSVVASNVIKGIQGSSRPAVVLQHDIKGFSVNAVEEIVTWGLANGYTFLPLDSSSPMVHHGVNN